MPRYETVPELRRAFKCSGIFLLYAGLLYLLLAGAAHLLKKGGRDPVLPANERPGRQDLEVKSGVSGNGEPDTACYWVYLGEFSGKRNRWIRKNFDLQAMPEKGQQIISLTDLFKWNDLPCPSGEEWKLGKIMGLIVSSETVKVVKVEKIRKGNYWALVRQ